MRRVESFDIVRAVAGDLTWIGHSTSLIDAGGYRILTDPLLTGRVAHLRRRRGEPVADAADADLVLISHAHMDHLHLPSLRRLRPDARVITPRGTGRLIRKAGLTDVVEVEPGDRVESGPAIVEVVEADHKHGRGPHSRVSATPVGYVADLAGHRTYYAGDTDLFPAMADLADIDVALLPIWGWGPTIGEGHLDPVRAVEAVRLIAPQRVVPIHWGTYTPENGRRRLPHWIDTPSDRFVEAMAGTDARHRLVLLEPGESVSLSPPAG